MLLKECARCKRLIPYGSTYCSECKPIVDMEIEKRKQDSIAKAQRKYNKARDPKYITFYRSKAWRMLAQRYTQDKGFRCERCGSIATNVHHIKPIQTEEGWELRLDYNNLELLCVRCHNERHERFKAKKKSI